MHVTDPGQGPHKPPAAKPKQDDKPKGADKADKGQGPQTARAAARQELKAAFEKADKNHDGLVKGKEMKALTDKLPDLNGDGKFDWDEGLKSLTFKGRDINQDGKLSGSELKGLDATKYQVGEDGELDTQEYLGGKQADRQAFRAQKIEGEFAKLDVNDDGKLSGTELKGIKDAEQYGEDGVDAEEFKKVKSAQWREQRDALLEKDFDKADKNNDGKLTGNEIGDYKGYDDTETDDGVGEISREEFDKGWKAERQARFEDRLLNGAPPPEKKDDKEKAKAGAGNDQK